MLAASQQLLQGQEAKVGDAALPFGDFPVIQPAVVHDPQMETPHRSGIIVEQRQRPGRENTVQGEFFRQFPLQRCLVELPAAVEQALVVRIDVAANTYRTQVDQAFSPEVFPRT